MSVQESHSNIYPLDGATAPTPWQMAVRQAVGSDFCFSLPAQLSPSGKQWFFEQLRQLVGEDGVLSSDSDQPTVADAAVRPAILKYRLSVDSLRSDLFYDGELSTIFSQQLVELVGEAATKAGAELVCLQCE